MQSHAAIPEYICKNLFLKNYGLLGVGSTYDTGSIGLISDTSASPRLRTSVEAVTIYRLMEILEMRIVSEGLYSSFLQVSQLFLPGLRKYFNLYV